MPDPSPILAADPIRLPLPLGTLAHILPAAARKNAHWFLARNKGVVSYTCTDGHRMHKVTMPYAGPDLPPMAIACPPRPFRRSHDLITVLETKQPCPCCGTIGKGPLLRRVEVSGPEGYLPLDVLDGQVPSPIDDLFRAPLDGWSSIHEPKRWVKAMRAAVRLAKPQAAGEPILVRLGGDLDEAVAAFGMEPRTLPPGPFLHQPALLSRLCIWVRADHLIDALTSAMRNSPVEIWWAAKRDGMVSPLWVRTSLEHPVARFTAVVMPCGSPE